MYTERFSLPFLSRVLIAAAERRRPGLGMWTPKSEGLLRETFVAELAEARRNFLELFDDKPYFDKLERTLMEVCFPRYARLAESQTALEHRGYGVWRSGDLVARGALAVGGFIVGAFLARAPFIPIPATFDWVVFAISAIGAPFLPDLHVWMHHRRYAKALERIVSDMGEAAEQQRVFAPIDPLATGAPSSEHPEPEALKSKQSKLAS